MKKLKHTKLKNTSIIFEVLISKLVNEVMGGNKNPPAMAIMQKYFNSKAILFKELGLYRSLTNNKNINEKNIDKYIDMVIESRKRMPDSTLKSQKYNIIKEMRKTYGEEELQLLFQNKMKNYTIMASVYKLFEHESADNPSEIMECRQLLETNFKNTPVEESTDSENVWAKMSKGMRASTFRILIDKFNKKYDGLSKDQKHLLECMINTPEKLQDVYEIHRKKIISEYESLLVDITDEVLRIKINEIHKHIEKPTNARITDNHISVLMRSYQLIDELKKK